jgi:hypothetical protein
MSKIFLFFTKKKLTGYVSILEDLTKSISEHIPNNVSIENIRIEALDIDSKL